MSERPEEPKIIDPSTVSEPDMRLTLREWVLYWKVKYETMLTRFQDVAELIGKQKQMMKDQMLTIAKLNDQKAELEKQVTALQADRQAVAKAEGGAPGETLADKKFKAPAKKLRAAPPSDPA